MCPAAPIGGSDVGCNGRGCSGILSRTAESTWVSAFLAQGDGSHTHFPVGSENSWYLPFGCYGWGMLASSCPLQSARVTSLRFPWLFIQDCPVDLPLLLGSFPALHPSQGNKTHLCGYGLEKFTCDTKVKHSQLHTGLFPAPVVVSQE